MDGPCFVLLDEVETLAPDRKRVSFETNPADVHRGTDAALAGIDLLTRKHRNVLLIATTNFREAVDRALMSRADWIEEMGLPAVEHRTKIIAARSYGGRCGGVRFSALLGHAWAWTFAVSPTAAVDLPSVRWRGLPSPSPSCESVP